MTLEDIKALGIREHCMVTITATGCSPTGFRAEGLEGVVSTLSRARPEDDADYEAIKIWPAEDRPNPAEGKLWFLVSAIESLTHDPDCNCDED